MLLAIVSDTHMPRRDRALPPACVQRLQQADLILHVGDLSDLTMLAELEAYGPVAAIHGNVDDAEVRGRLPTERVVEVERARIAIVHDAGPAAGRLARLRGRFPEADAVVFGHSHLPLHERSPDGAFQIFNPGSPTERRRAPRHTMGMARVDGRGLAFELVALD